MHVAFVAFALMVNSGGGGAKASPAEDELAVLVEYTVQEIGLQPHRCKASRGQKEMGQIDCSRYAGRLGAVASTWLTGDGDPAHKKPSAGQICKMFRPIYSARAYMPHVTHLGVQACIQALELQYRKKSSKAGVGILEMLAKLPHLEDYFLRDDEAAELHATWSRMYATLDDLDKAAVKAEDAANKFFRVHDWLRGAMLIGDVINLQQSNDRQQDAINTFSKYTDGGWVHWRYFLQRPLSFMPFLASAPFPGYGMQPPDMSTAQLLKTNFHLIQDEFDAVMRGKNKDAFNALVKTDPRLVSKGERDDFGGFEFRRDGRWNEKECKLMPTVCKLLKQELPVVGRINIGAAARANKEHGGFLVPTSAADIADADADADADVDTVSTADTLVDRRLWYHSDYAGKRANIDTLMLSKSDGYVPDQVVAIRRLSARSSITVHAGSTNANMNIQFGLRVPPGTYLRVGTETRQWSVGEPTIWDESFEHEVKNTADVPRYVLHVQVWHPGLMPLVHHPNDGGAAAAARASSAAQQQQHGQQQQRRGGDEL